MQHRFPTAPAVTLAVLAALLLPTSAGAECSGARAATTTANLPAKWHAAVDALVASTSEPGHPWSCAGGQVELEITRGGAILRVTPEGEGAIARFVATPDDVMPLGQALLASPFAHAPAESAPELPAPPPPPPAKPAPPAAAAPTTTPTTASTTTPIAPLRLPEEHPRILVGIGLDVRGAGNSGVGLIGPSASAAVPLGLWLPSIGLRGQTSIGSKRSPIGDFSVALGLQRRIPLRAVELRGGLAFRGAVVLRDLPRPEGQQAEIQARAGAVLAVMVPIVHWARIVVSADGDVVVASARTADPVATSDSLTAFPTYTLGGSVGVEVPL